VQNKDKGDGIEDSPLDMLLVILLEGASKEVVWWVTPSSSSPSWREFDHEFLNPFFVLGRPKTKSIEMSTQGLEGIGKGV